MRFPTPMHRKTGVFFQATVDGKQFFVRLNGFHKESAKLREEMGPGATEMFLRQHQEWRTWRFLDDTPVEIVVPLVAPVATGIIREEPPHDLPSHDHAHESSARI